MSKIRFQRKPMPLIADYRPIYKIFQILSVLHYSSRGGKSSLIRLHLINWILKSPERKEQLATVIEDSTIPFKVWGIDPALNFGLQFGVAQGLIEQNKDNYSITKEGKELMLKAKKEGQELPESTYLQRIGKGITETLVQGIVEKWN
ncbi:hypothetical protein [Agaribacterium haliotis]|uniref:hypothetical protein n=1 Tax=Agaribacterium haliotis TaxID=2013869 RepID=UPI000BB56288|nr:hypothetical protein [Agaribacterium haliotis]